MNISDFFQNTLNAKLRNTRWSWGAFNPTTNQLFLRVWKDHLEKVAGVETISILRKDWDGKSPGYRERERHVEAMRSGVEGYGVLCTAKDPDAIARTIANFNQELLLRFGKLTENDNYVYAHVVEYVPIESLVRHKSAYSMVVPDLKSIMATQDDVTTKEALVNARVGQGAFRAQVLEIWGNRCCVTGSTTLDAVRASHIKPWRVSNNQERLDPCNGLPLVATLDALFDAGLITFSTTGTLLTSSQLEKTEREILGLTKLQLTNTPCRRTEEYLAYHRESVFQKDVTTITGTDRENRHGSFDR